MDTNASLTLFSARSFEEFASVNVPASVVSILMNVFFIYCMVFQQSEQEQLKQPLNVLQGILVGCNITINIGTLLNVCFRFFLLSWETLTVPFSLSYTMMLSVAASSWQNVFYYFQITPAHSYFICLKKNIRVFMYCSLLIFGVVYLCGLSLLIVIIIVKNNVSNGDISTNSHYLKVSFTMNLVLLVTVVFLALNLCGMSTSSCATVIYLWKHLKNMEESSTISSPRFQRQIRMTIISIAMHALINLICSLGFFIAANYDETLNVLCTIVSMYALGTSISQGFAQSLFRQQVAFAWKKFCF